MDYVTTGRSPEHIRDVMRPTDAEEERRYWEERNRERFEEIAKLSPRTDHPEARAKLAAAKAKRQHS